MRTFIILSIVLFTSGVGTADPKCDAKPGYYCAGASPADCVPGFFCPGGDNKPMPCYIGTYCPANAPAPIACLPGTLCNHEKEQAATPCPEGFFCDGRAFFECPDKSKCGKGSCVREGGCPEEVKSTAAKASTFGLKDGRNIGAKTQKSTKRP
jgi:hypothetical protein